MKVSHSRVIFLKGGPSQMKINTVWAAYFSATDTTKTVVTQIAKELARHTGRPLETFDFTPVSYTHLTLPTTSRV